jgi:hypothetical protein
MNRLVAFGCSCTWGEALPDTIKYTHRSYGAPPSIMAWPQVLSNKLNLKCVNKGIAGASNKEILDSILNFKFKPTDKVYILWTYCYRDCTFVKPNELPERITLPDVSLTHRFLNSKKNKLYAKYMFNEYNSFTESHMYANHAKLYLDKKGIENTHMVFMFKHNDINQCWFNKFDAPKWNNVKFLKLRFITDYADDDSHPSIRSHAELAQQIYKKIKL